MYEVLEEIGLSKNEAKTYLALLELGKNTTTPIARKAKIERSNTYYSLEGLQSKGLISVETVNGVKHFTATNPDFLERLMIEKQQRVQEIIPKLKLYQNKNVVKNSTKTYQGQKAYWQLINDMTNYGEPIMIMGKEKDYVQAKLNRISEEKQISLEIIKGMNQKITTYICGNEVMMVDWKNNPTITQIINPRIAESYKQIFMRIAG